jgi:flagellar hook-length control protein FliK
MQNLPFLVTQNPTSQKTGVANQSTKQVDTNVSFKDVLSKQAEQMPTEGSLEKSLIIKPTRSQKVDRTTAEVPTDQTPAITNKNLIAEASKDAGIAVSDYVNIDRTLLTVQKISKDTAEQVPLELSSDEEATQVTPVEVNAALVASLQLPVLNSQISQSISSNNVDAAKAQQFQAFPNILTTEKQTHDFDKNLPTIDQRQVEAGTNNQSLLEAQPKAAKLGDNTESFGSVFAAKLPTEQPFKSIQEPLAKLPQDATSLTQTGIVSTVASSVISKEITAQTGSADSIKAYPGKAGWDQAISQKVVWMVGAAEKTATLTLNPPDLGPLQVVVSVNNDKADTTFISENPEVRKVLENGIPTLRHLMGQAGIELGQTNVGTGKQQQEFQQTARERLALQTPANTPPQLEEDRTITRTVNRTNNGLVDTFA